MPMLKNLRGGRGQRRKKPRNLPFTLEDHAAFRRFARAFRDQGITWIVETGRPEWLEAGTIAMRGMPRVRVWRSSMGLHFHDLTAVAGLRPECGETAFVAPEQIWAQIMGVIALRWALSGIRTVARDEPFAVALLPAWLRD